jgi:hypothetical protein
VTSFLTQSSADLGVRDWAIAEVGRVVVGLIAQEGGKSSL